MVNIILCMIFPIHKYTAFFSIIQYQRVKISGKKKALFLYMQKKIKNKRKGDLF